MGIRDALLRFVRAQRSARTFPRRFAVLLLSLALPAGGAGQQPASGPPKELTLDDAVALALRHNRLIQISALDVEKLDEDVKAFRTNRLPALRVHILESTLLTPLTFEFQQGVFGTYPTIGPIPGQDTGITTPRRLNTYFLNTVDQPLSQLYKIGLGVRSKELSREISREDLRLKQQEIRNRVTRVYYDLAQTQSALDAAQQTVTFYAELDRVTDRFLEQQVVLKDQSLDVKMRLVREQLETVKLRDRLDTEQEQLNQLLGRDIRERFRVAVTPTPTLAELDLPTAQASALKQRPEIRQAMLKKQQAEFDRRIKKAEYIPDLSLSFQHLSFVNVEMLPQNVMSAGLTLNWEPFDWGRKRHELAEKTKAVAQSDAAIHETEGQVLIDVNTQFRKVQEAAASLRVTELAMEAAREKLRVTTSQYRVQAVRLDQVLEAQATVSSAASQYQRTLSDYWTARADLAKATGEE